MVQYKTDKIDFIYQIDIIYANFKNKEVYYGCFIRDFGDLLVTLHLERLLH